MTKETFENIITDYLVMMYNKPFYCKRKKDFIKIKRNKKRLAKTIFYKNARH